MNKISTKKTTLPLISKMNKTVDNKNEFSYEPGNNIINAILNYSKALSIRKSKKTGYFEMMLN